MLHVKYSLSIFSDYRKQKKAVETSYIRQGTRLVMQMDQDGYFLNINVALVPPKPKEFDMAVVMFCFLATFGT